MNRKNHSGIFMMEMIAVVLFFILCAVICIQTFVKADIISRKASDLNQCVRITQSVAEIWKADGQEGLKEQFPSGMTEDNTESYLMGFDRNGSPCEIGEAVFDVKAQFTDSVQAEISVSREENTVYSLKVSRHETR